MEQKKKQIKNRWHDIIIIRTSFLNHDLRIKSKLHFMLEIDFCHLHYSLSIYLMLNGKSYYSLFNLIFALFSFYAYLMHFNKFVYF